MSQKIYEVMVSDIWSNNYHIGFFTSLEDPQLIDDINSYIINEKFKIQSGDIREYSGTWGPVCDTSVYDIAYARYGDDVDADDDDDLQLQIRGFVWDEEELKDEINNLI